MTRKKAIKRLKEIDIRDALQEDYDALYMAIEALEQNEALCDRLNAVEEENERLREENERLIEDMDDLRDRTYDYLMLEE